MRAKSLMAEVYGGMKEKELHFQDIIEIALQIYEKQNSIIEFLKIISNEVLQKNVLDGYDQLNYREFF